MAPSPRRPLDAPGFWLMVALAMLFGANNLMIKLGNDGLQPVIFAGARSAVAALALGLWIWARGIRLRLELWGPGVLLGLCFTVEFLLLFVALDQTTVVRASSLFYAMPIWLALAAHVLFPGERLTPVRFAGFLLGFAGVVITFAGRPDALAGGSLWGDAAALVAGMGWAAIVVVSRSTAIGNEPPEAQLFWQVLVSAVLLCAAAPLYGGPFVRDFNAFQAVLFLVQAIGVVTVGFVLWFWLIGRYQASTVASFSFLTPALSALLGWALLGEEVMATTPVALALLIAGLVLINRRPRARAS
ncbi:MAG: DMT family transporter [Pararhodobacter sp.]